MLLNSVVMPKVTHTLSIGSLTFELCNKPPCRFHRFMLRLVFGIEIALKEECRGPTKT